MSDQEAQEALKDFIIKVFDEIYLRRLKHSRLGYKNVTLLQFMNLLRDDFQSQPEERDKIKKALQENSNTAKHIEHLFDQIKDLLETLADMNGNNNYMDDEFIEATYMAVKRTREFNKDCEKWKRLPEAQRNTKDLCRTYFRDQYKEFNSQRDTLHDVGVANAAVQDLQGGLQVAQNQVAALQLQLEEQKNEIDSLKSTQTHPTATASYGSNDSSISSNLMAMTAQAMAKL